MLLTENTRVNYLCSFHTLDTLYYKQVSQYIDIVKSPIEDVNFLIMGQVMGLVAPNPQITPGLLFDIILDTDMPHYLQIEFQSQFITEIERIIGHLPTPGGHQTNYTVSLVAPYLLNFKYETIA